MQLLAGESVTYGSFRNNLTKWDRKQLTIDFGSFNRSSLYYLNAIYMSTKHLHAKLVSLTKIIYSINRCLFGMGTFWLNWSHV